MVRLHPAMEAHEAPSSRPLFVHPPPHLFVCGHSLCARVMNCIIQYYLVETDMDLLHLSSYVSARNTSSRLEGRWAP